MTDATGETDRAGHRLLELGREWSIQGEDIFEVVGTGQVISPGSFEESIYEEIVEVSRGSQIILSWAHMFTATAVVASVWFLLSTRPFPSIWRTIIAALSDFRKSPIKSKVHSSGSCDSRNSTMASSSTGTLRATNRVVANQHRENLTQDALVAYASTPEIRSSSPSATMQIVVVPEQESTGTLCITELSRQITVQAAREVVAAADILDQVLEESGRPRDPSVTLNWAAELHKTSRKLQARQQEEQRRYMYDNWQRETDRAISEQQHQESISAIKEESGCGWAEKLANIRDRCFESVFTAIVRGVVLVAVSRLVPHLFLNPNILSFSTFFNLLKAAFTTVRIVHFWNARLSDGLRMLTLFSFACDSCAPARIILAAMFRVPYTLRFRRTLGLTFSFPNSLVGDLLSAIFCAL
jgi:hypothetical protein